MKTSITYILLVAIVFCFSALVQAQQDNEPQNTSSAPYQEHGVVIAVRTPAPNIAGGIAGVLLSRGSYRVDTPTRVYEFSTRGRKPEFALGQMIDFQVGSDGKVYLVGNDGKQHKYRLLSVEEKEGSALISPNAASQ
jgi:hypothetical protein